MTLFVVRHQHAAERCPARDPYLGAELLNYLSRPNVRQHGVEIQGEAVVKGEHTLFFVAEALDEPHLREFLQPFESVGTVDIYPASTCARVVTNGGCTASLVEEAPTAVLDPEEACQLAIDAGLVVHKANPLNCETSIPALLGGVVMPNAHFYIRNHFQMPKLDADSFRLSVSGLVERPLSLSLRDLHNMRSKSLLVTLECAGNGRALFQPPIEGEKWDLGAMSTAEWTGVSLVDVLDRAGVRAQAREVLFRGADGGHVSGQASVLRFERSLLLDHARDRDVLLAYAMNGEALPIQHGHPLRLIVPSWYAVASVKWLTEIELIERTFTGYYQTQKYWYEWLRDGELVREPVTVQHVRSLITEPADGQRIPRGECAIRGVAWSGAAPIARVEVSVGGRAFEQTQLLGERKRHSWQWWELVTKLNDEGPVSLRVRATDLAGRTQPERAEWNQLGYGNNALHEIRVLVGS